MIRQYALLIQLEEFSTSFTFGWYISPKKAIASYKRTPYPRDLRKMFQVQIIEQSVETTERILDFKIEDFL